MPGAHREGLSTTRNPSHLGRRLDEHGAPVGRHEEASLAAPTFRTGHHRWDGARHAPAEQTSWESYVEDYDRIRDKMAEVLDGFEDFNRRVRLPLGFRIRQPARELVFLTPSGRAEFSAAPLPHEAPLDDALVLQTMRSHDQWNTTIYSDNDRYRGIKNVRTLILMNADDMSAAHIKPGDLVDITATARDGSQRCLRRYRAFEYDMPRGCAAGYMPEMNVLIVASDYSTQSNQPLMKNIKVRVSPSPEQ